MPERVATLWNIRRLWQLLHRYQAYESWKPHQLYNVTKSGANARRAHQEDHFLGRARHTWHALPEHRAPRHKTQQYYAQRQHWKCRSLHWRFRKRNQNAIKRWNKKAIDRYQRLHCSRNAQKQTLQFSYRCVGIGLPHVPLNGPENAILPREWQEKSKIDTRKTSRPKRKEYSLIHWRSKKFNWRDVVKGAC